MSVLTVTGLSQRFLDKVLYQDASFQVNIEDHLGVIGQNGVGKSTLIKILTGALQVKSSGRSTYMLAIWISMRILYPAKQLLNFCGPRLVISTVKKQK